jgi:hypothetical protein
LASTSRSTRFILGSTSIEADGLCGLIEQPCEVMPRIAVAAQPLDFS